MSSFNIREGLFNIVINSERWEREGERERERERRIINPRRACARVTVLVLSVCVFSLFWHLAQSGVQTAVSATSAQYGHEI